MPYSFKDPSSLLRPWPTSELQFFAEEIYSLLVSGEAEDLAATPVDERVKALKEIRAKAIETPVLPTLREARLAQERARTLPPEYPTFTQPPPTVTPSAPPPGPSRPTPPTKAGTPSPTTVTFVTPEIEGISQVIKARDSQATTPRTSPFSTEEGFKKGGGEYSKYPVPFGNTPIVPTSGVGSSIFMGKVVSGTGNTYEVRLYQSGPDGTPDDFTVEVKIPQIDSGETIPVNTWLTGIMAFVDTNGNTTFACQPTVWIA